MLKEAIVLAGGFGTRLRSVVADLPKPMAPVNGQPFLNYLLRYLSYSGIERVVLSTGYQSEKIKTYYDSNPAEKLHIRYSHEQEPLGTGGAIALALAACIEKEVVVVNGDSFFDADLKDLYTKHVAYKATHSLALRSVENASRYGAIELSGNRLISFKEKSEEAKPGLINGGIYILNRGVYLESTAGKQTFSIEKDFFEKELQQQQIFGFEYKGQFIDIGTPEDFTRAQDEFKHFTY